MNQDLIQIQQLTKRFATDKPPALNKIQVSFPNGKIVGIAGPDGAGKTTLLRLIAGLLLPTSGSITVGGYDSVVDAHRIHSFLGYMPQKFGLYEDLSVLQNLTLYADLKGVVDGEREKDFERLLSFTSLQPFTERSAKDLSGGMKQKLGLACALLGKPKVLLLDEPSVGVDPISRRELWKMVYELVEEGITVLWSTSYLDEAEHCHFVLLLNDGEVLFNGPPRELTDRVNGRVFLFTGISNNRREFLAKALQQKNIIDGVIQGQNVRVVIAKDANVDSIFSVLECGREVHCEPAVPRFEDAFIDILGGCPKGQSDLAFNVHKVSACEDGVIKANNLTKKFGSFTAADHITFAINSGEIFGLLGPNGAGKSTTFKMMCGLQKPTSGNALVNGLDLQIAPSKARSQIGYMAQKFSLYGNLSVYQNLQFFSGIYNVTGNERKKKVEEMIAIFNLKSYLSESADTLPLGYKQRLALSCSLMHNPSVLFLDEPTSGVDPITRREFWGHINELVEKGVTVMVTTHFMDEAEYCDRIGLIYRSKLIKVGTPDELKADARTDNNPYPTLEDAFIQLIEQYDDETANFK